MWDCLTQLKDACKYQPKNMYLMSSEPEHSGKFRKWPIQYKGTMVTFGGQQAPLVHACQERRYWCTKADGKKGKYHRK